MAKSKPTVLTKESLKSHHAGLPKSKHGHPFAHDPLPPGFHTIIDPNTHPLQPWRDLPQPTGFPPFRMSLDAILDAGTLAGIAKSKTLVFHAVGDTGGVNTPTYIDGVTRFMECDFTYAQAPNLPAFFYHLGDVVYYDGESANYWPEFYEPYQNYPGPIVAIPGNHDGDVNPATGETSLQAFVRNFCSQTALHSPDNRDAPRRTMIQPNVYWTLNTPLVTIIGLYSNCPEGGQVSDVQREWLVGELGAADAKLPIVLAVHHPIYSAYGSHPGSARLKTLLEESCASAGRTPDVVLTGHVHNYQRFTAPLHDKSRVPFIVAGAGGYNQRLHRLGKPFQEAKAKGRLPVRIDGDPAQLEDFNDVDHGYLRITVAAKRIILEYVTVPDPSSNAPNALLKPYDSVSVDF